MERVELFASKTENQHESRFSIVFSDYSYQLCFYLLSDLKLFLHLLSEQHIFMKQVAHQTENPFFGYSIIQTICLITLIKTSL